MDPSTIMVPVRESLSNFDNNVGPRRNISVFSRRGTATPNLISVRNAKERSRADIDMAGRHRKLIACKKLPRRTVLYAVPPTGVQKLASLEERMATDPNNEIVSSIRNTAPTQEQDSCFATHAAAIDHQSGDVLSPSRIGTWVDGVVYWEKRITDQDSSTSAIPTTSANHRTSPPCESIPEPQIRKVNSLTQILRPRPTRPVVLTPPSVQVQTSPDTPTQCVAADDRSYSLGQHLSSRGPSVASKRSLSPVSDISHVEGSSACSSRSSATSVETALVVGKFSRPPEYSPNSTISACDYDGRAGDCDGCWPAHQARPFHGRDSVEYHDSPQQTALYRQSFLLDPSPTSPTWSQAEDALNYELDGSPVDRLSMILEQGIELNNWPQSSFGTLHRTSSVRKVMQPPSVAPPVPKRSRKREWCTSAVFSGNAPSRRRSETELRGSTNAQDAGSLRKAASVSIAKAHALSRSNSVRPSLPRKSSKRPLSKVMVDDHSSVECTGQAPSSHRYEIYQEAETTEDVLLHILSSLESPKDLINTAMMNKGMYRIYKENEMYLLQRVTYNGSPALWEFGEWQPPTRTETAADTPLEYMRCYRRDQAVVERLKDLILGQCQTFIRRETALALADFNHPQAQRFNDAFWRVWTFCKIFGCGKGREEDIAGQIDWLRGGVIANEDYVSATVDTNFDVYSASVLLNPPECFARGNEGGLSAAQLFDMTEIWTCMTVLLQKYHGQLELARQHGVFHDCHVQPGDFTREDHLLEEWTLHLLTLGSDVVLEMAELASINEALGFATAEQNGWTHWSPQASRRNFLKEPVSRCYEDQVAKMQQVLSDPREQAKKDLHRRRVSSLAAEIRLRRQSSDYRHLPLIDMEHERPMSMSSRQNSVRSVRSGWTDISPISPTPRESSSALLSAVSPIAQQWLAPRNMAPILEERVHADSRLTGRSYGRGFADDTSLRAVRQLVSMGFPEQKAKEALRTTDMGDGLRVDRAVELLLREQQ